MASIILNSRRRVSNDFWNWCYFDL